MAGEDSVDEDKKQISSEDPQHSAAESADDNDDISLPLSARREREAYRPSADESATGEPDDDISLPLSAHREQRHISARHDEDEPEPTDDEPQTGAADEDIDDGEDEDDDEVSLPLSARRESAASEVVPAPVSVRPAPPEPTYREIPQGNKLTGRGLLECLVMVGISLLLALVGFYVPVVNIIGLLLFPLPLAVLVFRNGLLTGCLGAVVLFGLSAVFWGIPTAATMIIEYGVLGIFMGFCFRRQKGPLFTMGFAIVIAACGTMVGLMLSLFVAGLPFSAMTDTLTQFFNDYFATLNNSGLDALIPGGMTMDAFIQSLSELATKLVPALLIISSMVMAAVCYWVSSALLRHRHYAIPQMPPFRDWRMDWRFSWGVIAGLACTLAGKYFAISWLSILGMNILYVFCPVLLICGLAFVVWLFKQPIYSPFFKMLLILMMLFFMQVTFFVLMVLAVFEPIIDFRGRLEKAMEKLGRR